MPSLIGNKPNQVPSNGDLGTLAFQDANAVNITGGAISGNIASTGINIDSNTLVVDATNNRVGVGIASPVGALDVVTSGAGLIRMRSSTGAGTVGFQAQNSDTGTTTTDGLFVGIDGSDQGYVFHYENAPLIFGTNGTERMRINSDGGLQTATTGGGSIMETFGCRAWVNFNGNGTVAIRGSGNVSSITDGGTGQYTVNLTTALPDANAAVAGAASENGALSDKNRVFCANMATSSTAFIHVYASTNEVDEDVAFVAVSIFR